MTENHEDLIRAHPRFRDFILSIKKERELLKMKKLSYKKITLLIVRHHSFVPRIKYDIVNYVGDYDDE